MPFPSGMECLAKKTKIALTTSRVAKTYRRPQPTNSLTDDLPKLIKGAGLEVPVSKEEQIKVFTDIFGLDNIKPTLHCCKNPQKRCGHRIPCESLFCDCKVNGRTYEVMLCRCEHERSRRDLALWGDSKFWSN